MKAQPSVFQAKVSALWAGLLAAFLAAGCAAQPTAHPAPKVTTAQPPTDERTPNGSLPELSLPGEPSPGLEPTLGAEASDIPGGADAASTGSAGTAGAERPSQPPAQATHAVIVTLNVPFTPEGYLGSEEAVRAQRAAIAYAQSELLAALAGHTVVVVARYEFTPQLALVVDDGALSVLMQSPLVAHIQANKPVPPASTQ